MKEKVERINFLARKAKAEGLTQDESLEQKSLRDEYIAAFRANMEATLDTIYTMDEEGNRVKLAKRTYFTN